MTLEVQVIEDGSDVRFIFDVYTSHNEVCADFLECHYVDPLQVSQWISSDKAARKRFPRAYANAKSKAIADFDPLEEVEDFYGQAQDEAYDRLQDRRHGI